MKIQIVPTHRADPTGKRVVIPCFTIIVDDWGMKPMFKTYDGACRVANAIADAGVNDTGVVTIDYSECL